MANIFPKNKVREKAEEIPTEKILPFINIIKGWQDDYHQGSLKKDKETSREQNYNHDFFITILGYTSKPSKDWTFEPQPSTIVGQRPDAILSNADEANIFAVVELKDAGVSIDRPQKREGNMSPIQQAFKYKPLYRHCPFVIVSNFWEFRLYQDNQLDYEVWTLDDLVNPENDYVNFKSWYVLLCAKNFIAKSGNSATEKLLSEVREEQEKISKNFYAEYKEARLHLLRDLYKKNIDVRKNFDMGISKAQKIIDRIVFVCFAEDRGLLPDNKLHEVISFAKNNPFNDVWGVLKNFFSAVDLGSEKLEIPDGYNGGLFKEDDVLNSLKISDEVLENVAGLSKYDFEQDLSVSILGHIFEQSISDLEEIKSKVNIDTIGTSSKRKKDSIFYTPDYIVHYIVENSLGSYLRENEERIKQEYGLKEDILDRNYEKREKEAYEKYQDFLQNIKVIDPACGSGAFLVYVFDYLLAENKRVGDILGGSLFSTDDYVREILKNNIYGVDLNEESVEITRLSLWLKTAQKGKKLTTLDKNIKCGNSLIDDPEIAGRKAFKWENEFPEVFANGGFDVVVGNPPYVATKQIPTEDRNYFWNKYADILFSEMDLYEIFTLKAANELLKEKGYLGFITPNSYYTSTSFEKYRKFLLHQNDVKIIVDFPYRFFPFSEVNTETAIIILKKWKVAGQTLLWTADKSKVLQYETVNKFTVKVSTRVKNFELATIYDSKIISNLNGILSKILSIKGRFGDKVELHKGWMSVPKQTEFNGQVIESGKFNKSEVEQYGIQEICQPYLEGRDIHRYSVDKVDKFVNIYRMDKKTESWHYQEKIILQRIVGQNKNKIFATYDDSNSVIFPNANLVICRNKETPKPYLAILNSTLISYFYNLYFGESNTNLTKSALEGIPLPQISLELTETLSVLTDKIISLNVSKNKLRQQFLRRLTENIALTKLSKKLEHFDELTFKAFLAELKKSKVQLTLKQQDEWEPYFDEYKTQLTELSAKLTATDKQIDALVYKLYGMTEDEIRIVEESMNA